MIDQQQFAPPSTRTRDAEPAVETPPTRDQIAITARDVAIQLGAPAAEVLSCLSARLHDAKGWLPVTGPEEARIWLVIVRAAVGVPRKDGRVLKGQRIEVAIDAANGKTLGFRLAS